MGRCGAPCAGRQSVEEYAVISAEVADLLTGDSRQVMARLRERMSTLAEQQRFEDAQTVRDRTLSLVRGAARAQRMDPLSRTAELVAARRHPITGGWEIIVVRHGRLAGSSQSPRGADPMPYIEALRASAEIVTPPAAPATAATPEETDKILRWLETPGVRIVDITGQWTCPVGGAGSARAELEPLAVSAANTVGFAHSA
jgi:DNA polymerase-3 subunit epsilon